MVRKIGMFLLAFAGVCASTVLASAQTKSSLTEATHAAASPVAYVYVSNYVSSTGVYQVNGYAAAANGSLTPIPGSPFADSVNQMAVNGAWLFGTEQTSTGTTGNVNSYSIASNGALTLAQQTQVNDSGGGPTYLLLDHTGSSLYVDYYTANNDCLSYSIDQSSGALTDLSILYGGPGTGCPVTFTGNNQFAYSSSCYHFTPIIYGRQRNSDGSLSDISINPALPTAPPGTGFCPYLGAAADPSNHVAIAVTPAQGGFGNNDGPTQLAVYTSDNSGNLSTNSTYLNMPKTGVVPMSGGTYSVNDYWASPSGKLLAVAGPLGLQVFHFNGGNPITPYTRLLTHDYVNQLEWDNANHLYAISASTRKLYVFTVTPTSVSEAPGSPHNIPGMASIIVLPKR
jgi:lactonase family protein with 7-bladed beta-propeller